MISKPKKFISIQRHIVIDKRAAQFLSISSATRWTEEFVSRWCVLSVAISFDPVEIKRDNDRH